MLSEESCLLRHRRILEEIRQRERNGQFLAKSRQALNRQERVPAQREEIAVQINSWLLKEFRPGFRDYSFDGGQTVGTNRTVAVRSRVPFLGQGRSDSG